MEMNSNSMTIGGCSIQTPRYRQTRWNPTKEQINRLEGLYKQGIRTPSAEQIKQITSKLKANNWVLSLPTSGMVKRRSSRTGVTMMEKKLESSNACGGAGFYPAHINRMVQHPDGMQGLVVGVGGGDVNEDSNINTTPLTLPSKNSRSRDRNETLELFPVHPTGVLDDHHQPNEDFGPCSCDVNEDSNINTTPLTLPSKNSRSSDRNETLELFPVHPTGALDDHHQPNEDSGPCSSCSSCSFSFPAERNDDTQQQPFFDFFAGQQQH